MYKPPPYLLSPEAPTGISYTAGSMIERLDYCEPFVLTGTKDGSIRVSRLFKRFGVNPIEGGCQLGPIWDAHDGAIIAIEVFSGICLATYNFSTNKIV
jgi:hypothetical protein